MPPEGEDGAEPRGRSTRPPALPTAGHLPKARGGFSARPGWRHEKGHAAHGHRPPLPGSQPPPPPSSIHRGTTGPGSSEPRAGRQRRGGGDVTLQVGAPMGSEHSHTHDSVPPPHNAGEAKRLHHIPTGPLPSPRPRVSLGAAAVTRREETSHRAHARAPPPSRRVLAETLSRESPSRARARRGSSTRTASYGIARPCRRPSATLEAAGRSALAPARAVRITCPPGGQRRRRNATSSDTLPPPPLPSPTLAKWLARHAHPVPPAKAHVRNGSEDEAPSSLRLSPIQTRARDAQSSSRPSPPCAPPTSPASSRALVSVLPQSSRALRGCEAGRHIQNSSHFPPTEPRYRVKAVRSIGVARGHGTR